VLGVLWEQRGGYRVAALCIIKKNMARFVQIVCDGCGDVVKGTKGMVGISKNNFAIRGMITYFDDDGAFVHITKRADEDMNFCDTKCFKDFCNRRLDEYNKRRESYLRREASAKITGQSIEPYDD
jgi:hypothetical protein